jgi:hypothetical protein
LWTASRRLPSTIGDAFLRVPAVDHFRPKSIDILRGDDQTTPAAFSLPCSLPTPAHHRAKALPRREVLPAAPCQPAEGSLSTRLNHILR